MTTGHVQETLPQHSPQCDCEPCRTWRGNHQTADPNDDLGWTTSSEGEAW